MSRRGAAWRCAAARLRVGARRHSWWLVVGSFAALTILIGLFSLNAVRAADERQAAERWHIHTLEVLLVADRLRVSTFDMLRGERGYLLTDNRTFLEPHDRGRERSRLLLRRLRALTADNEAQQRNVAAARQRLASFTAITDRAIALQRAGARDAAIAIVRQRHGRQEFERLQASIDALEQIERRLLIERREVHAASSAANERLFYGAAAIMVLLLLIAALAALAALRAQRLAAEATEELRLLATMDELTALPNRRLFLTRFREEAARAQRDRAPLCLATLDIDHFKQINDRYGHPAGDAVLRQVAATIRQRIRLGDSPARIGGEEFALILPATNSPQAQMVCDRLRDAVSASLFELPGGGAIRVTISTGVALLRDEDDCQALMSRSDVALYEAKQRGRNQVRLAA